MQKRVILLEMALVILIIWIIEVKKSLSIKDKAFLFTDQMVSISFKRK